MANDVHFEDYSVQVKAKLNDITVAWLYEVVSEIESQAKRNCKMPEDKKQLAGSYRGIVDESKGEATVGSPLESAFWEEFGTGEYAATDKNGGKKGRSGWWVYIEGGSGYQGYTKHHSSEAEAQTAAAQISKKHGVKAIATNGRRPAFTLANAFESVAAKSVKALEAKLKGME